MDSVRLAAACVVADRRAVGSECSPTSAAPAQTGWAVRVGLRMSVVAGSSVAATEELSVGQDAGVDFVGNRDYHGVARVVRRAEPGGADGARTGGVMALHFEPGGFGQR